MIQRETSRIRSHRQGELKADEIRLLDDVEKYGCHIIHVRAENESLGWSYTIGLYDVLQQPELIVVGLKEATAHSLLNDAARRLEGSVSLAEQRQTDLLANVECEFRPVKRRWLRQIMGYAIWFYGGDSFPALQCVYPDLNGCFPWEENFDLSWRDRQALLVANIPETRVEKDFWATNDPNSSIFSWKFSDPPHTGVYTTERILNGEEPVLYVSHDPGDGAWQFHGQSESRIESATLVCFHHLVDRDPTLKQLSDLPIGWCAWRDAPSDTWVRELKVEETP
jgi:Domain of unknown function (DUF4262)